MKNRILDAAARVFSQKGYYKACMDDIAIEAGVAKGSLYYHFKSKSGVFIEVVTQGMDWLCGEVMKVVQSNQQESLIASAIIDKMVDMFIDYPELCDIIMNEISNGIDEDTLLEIKKARNRYIALIAEVLHQGQLEGVFSDFDCDIVAASTISFVYTYQKSATQKGISDRKQISRDICNIVINGLFPHTPKVR